VRSPIILRPHHVHRQKFPFHAASAKLPWLPHHDSLAVGGARDGRVTPRLPFRMGGPPMQPHRLRSSRGENDEPVSPPTDVTRSEPPAAGRRGAVPHDVRHRVRVFPRSTNCGRGR